MTDIRRTILWVIFGFTLVLLWDKWQIYNGHKATFFPTTAKVAARVTKPAPVTPLAPLDESMATARIVSCWRRSSLKI